MTTTQTQTQRMAALAKAQQHRLARSTTKAWLRAAPTRRTAWRRLAGLLESPDAHLHTMRIGDLVDACRNTGPHAVLQVLYQAGITERTRVNTLSSRSREALLLTLRAGTIDDSRQR